MRGIDWLFALLSLVAVACFTTLIVLQAMERDFYKNPVAPHGGNIWTELTAPSATAGR